MIPIPNHVTNIITASKQVIDHMLRQLTPEERAKETEQHEESVANITARAAANGELPKWLPDAPDLDRWIVDFGLVIPQPPNIETGGCSHPSKFNRDPAQVKEQADGTICWYEWNIANWGTKWGAYNHSMDHERAIRFDTAWSHPYPILVALSKLYPSELIGVEYADEDLGHNLGRYTILDGHINQTPMVDGSEEALRFACEIKGWDYEGLMAERAEEEADV